MTDNKRITWLGLGTRQMQSYRSWSGQQRVCPSVISDSAQFTVLFTKNFAVKTPLLCVCDRGVIMRGAVTGRRNNQLSANNALILCHALTLNTSLRELGE